METERIFQKVHVAPARLLQQSVSLMGDEYWMFLAITFRGDGHWLGRALGHLRSDGVRHLLVLLAADAR